MAMKCSVILLVVVLLAKVSIGSVIKLESTEHSLYTTDDLILSTEGSTEKTSPPSYTSTTENPSTIPCPSTTEKPVSPSSLLLIEFNGQLEYNGKVKVSRY